MMRPLARWTGWLGTAAMLAAGLALLRPSMAAWLAVALLAAAWAAAIRATAGMPLSLDRLVRAGLLVVVAAALLLPALAGLVRSSGTVIDTLAGPGAAAARHDLLLVALVLGGLILAARRWPATLGETLFLVLATAVALAAKLAWVHLVDMRPWSDFAEMWELSSQVQVEGLGAAATSPDVYDRVYLERILPWLLPLRLAFGPEPSSYAVPNVLAGVLTSLVVYALARTWFGRPAARVAFVVSLAAVETALAAEIPSHDVPGALYSVLALAAFVQAARLLARGRARAALAAGAACGLLAVLADLQRTTGPFILLSCLAIGLAAVGLGAGRSATLDQRERLRRISIAAAVLVLSPAAVYTIGSRGLDATGLTVPPALVAGRAGMVIAAGSESWSDGTWGYFETNYRARYSSVDIDWGRLAVVKLASDTYYTPSARLTLALRKARFLFDLGTQTDFYARGAEVAGAGPIDLQREASIAFVSRCFSIFFLACFLAGALRSWRFPDLPLSAFLPLLYLAVLSGALLLLSEVQPRYLYQIWYLGAAYVGLALGGVEGAPPTRPSGPPAL